MKWLEAAQKIRNVMDTAGAMLDDKQASSVPALYPVLRYNGELVKAGTRINWHGQIKRAAVDLWDTAENDPDAAPALWSSIDYRDGVRVIPDIITAALAFSKGECGWWQYKIYESQLDGNVWTPEDYPTGWVEVADE